ncbi:MAG: RT0821/Lpp0805 family surface protein [Parvibaculum sp.]
MEQQRQQQGHEGRRQRDDNRGDNRPAQWVGNDSRQNRGGYDGRGDRRAQQPEFYRHDIRRDERTYRRDYRHDRHHSDWSDRRWLPPQVIYRNSYYYLPAPQTTIYVAPRDYYGYDDYDTYYRSTYGYRRPVCNSDAVGAFIGGILGGVIGANSSSHHGRGAVGGVIIGTLIGGVLGRAIDDSNQACVGEVLEYVPTNETVDWADPDTGGYYEVTPLRSYQRDEDTYCREYQTYIEIDGRSQRAYGTACRQPDGAWKQVPYQG